MISTPDQFIAADIFSEDGWEQLKILQDIFREIAEKDEFTPLIDRFAERVVCYDEGEGGTKGSVYRGKRQVAEFFNWILPQTRGFRKPTPMAFIPCGKKIIALGYAGETANGPDPLHAIIVQFESDVITEIRIMENLCYPKEIY